LRERGRRLIDTAGELRREAASAAGRRRLLRNLRARVSGYWKTKLGLLWQTARSNHTIVNAIAPPEEDILGSTLQDEQVIHIFWSTFLVELWMTFLISDENEGDFDLLATVYVGALCSMIGGLAAKIQSASFTFCNKKRRYQTWLDRLPGNIVYIIQAWRKQRRRKRRQAAKRKAAATGAGSAEVVAMPERRRAPTLSPMSMRVAKVKLTSPPPSPPNVEPLGTASCSGGAGGRGRGGASDAAKQAAELSEARRRWQKAGLVTAALRFQRRPKLTEEEKAAAAEQAEREAKEAERRKRMTLIPFSRRYVLIRWTCGWLFNFIYYIVLCAMDFVYGVQTGSVAFGQVMLAWLAALVFTYLVIEPAEIAGIVFLPMIAENKYVAWLQDRAKYYGLY
jgi:hypothetical protein